MKTVADSFSIVSIACFIYLMVAGYALRWMIDGEKIKSHGARTFRAMTLPRGVLTPAGVKIWWSRWIAGAGCVIFIVLSYYLHH